MAEINTDLLVAKYIELRDRKSAEKKKFEAATAEIDRRMKAIEEHLQTVLDAAGANSINTDHGTILKTHRESARVADWDTLLTYIRENNEWGLLERRVSTAHVKDLMEESRDGSYRNPPPPGVDFVRLASVQVRRKNK